MSKGTVNRVTIIGRLGADPEVRYMPNGTPVANLSIATNDSYKDKVTGGFIETTEWHKVVLFGRTAEIAQEFLKKGKIVYIEGKIKTSKWQDKYGQDRYSTEIICVDMQLLGGREAAVRQEPFGMRAGNSPDQSYNEEDEVPF